MSLPPVSRRTMLRAASLAPTVALSASAVRAAPGSLGTQGPGLVLEPGEHRVDANMTVRADILVLPGATINVAPGRVLRLAGDFIAARGLVFTGGGTIDMNAGRMLEACPEWWGATVDDPAVDSLPALDACVAAHPVTRLIEGRYYIGDTWRISLSNRRVWGTSASPLGRPRCTEIVLNDARKDVMLVGLANNPGSPGRFPEGIDVRHLKVTRSVPVDPPARGSEGEGPAGVRFQFVLRGHLEHVASTESTIGFVIRGTARSFVRQCEVLRTRSGSRRDNDIFWGFFFDGNVRIGFAGGNASIYLSDCFAKVEGSPALADSIGAVLKGGFADTYLINFEVAEMAQGILVDGSRLDPDRNLQKTGNADLHITMPILDQCRRTGLEVANLSDYALVEIIDPYVAPSPGALAAIHIHDALGLMTISGGQLLGPGGDTIGVHVVDAEGLAIRGTKIREHGRPVGLTRVRDFDVDVAINNPEVRATQGAVWLSGCLRGLVRARVKGGMDRFPQGVALVGTQNRALSIETTAIDPACIAGGGANVLSDNGHQIAAAGRFGNANLATGLLE